MIICDPVMTVKKNVNFSFSDSSVLCSWDLCAEQLESQMSPLVLTENINMNLRRSAERAFINVGYVNLICVSWEAVPCLQWVENVLENAFLSTFKCFFNFLHSLVFWQDTEKSSLWFLEGATLILLQRFIFLLMSWRNLNLTALAEKSLTPTPFFFFFKRNFRLLKILWTFKAECANSCVLL